MTLKRHQLIQISEYGRISREELGERLCSRLQFFDEKFRHEKDKPIFDWSLRKWIKAQNYVGVIQVPGLTIEILPKIDDSEKDGLSSAELAQSNLLYMLLIAGSLPARERDLAAIRLQKMPLLEAVINIFARRLVREMRGGIDHQYIREESNQVFLKGKLLVAEHIKRNAAHCEHLYVCFDQFISDTWLNRILKAACEKLIKTSRSNPTQLLLGECLLLFSEVKDVVIEPHHFSSVHLNRNTERYRPLLEFCKIVLNDRSTTPSVGINSSFVLLFPMEEVFEKFIANFIRRHHRQFNLPLPAIHVQARGHTKWLVNKSNGNGKFLLKPDILIKIAGESAMVIDTKWKVLKTDAESYRNNISQADLYQLFAYAHRYDAGDNVLLYPKIANLYGKRYWVPESEPKKRLRVEFVDVSQDMLKNQKQLTADLTNVLKQVA